MDEDNKELPCAFYEPAADSPQPLRRFCEEEVWPQIPADQLGESLSKAEREEILGYGPEGV